MISLRRATTSWHRLSFVVICATAVVASACGSSSPSVNTTQARAEVTYAYETLFNLANKSVSPKLAVIQDGSSLREAMTEALASPFAASAGGAKVHNVALLTSDACTQAAEASPCAKVTYDILSSTGGAPLQSGSAGYAVDVNGKWLVAKHTVCGMFELLYSTEGKSGSPPGC